MSEVLLEVCVDRLEDALAAEQAGADRLELCGALELGGLTPSIGLVEQVLEATQIDVVAMIRPRAGGFEFDDQELQVAWSDAERILAAGVGGLVFGALHPEGDINTEAVRTIVQLAGEKTTVFHRAFDYVPDTQVALDELIGCGVDRILTSGRQPTALQGAALIAELMQKAGGRIEVLPGGGIDSENVSLVVESTGCAQVHLSGSRIQPDASLSRNPQLATRDCRSFKPAEFRSVDIEKIASIKGSLGS